LIYVARLGVAHTHLLERTALGHSLPSSFDECLTLSQPQFQKQTITAVTAFSFTGIPSLHFVRPALVLPNSIQIQRPTFFEEDSGTQCVLQILQKTLNILIDLWKDCWSELPFMRETHSHIDRSSAEETNQSHTEGIARESNLSDSEDTNQKANQSDDSCHHGSSGADNSVSVNQNDITALTDTEGSHLPNQTLESDHRTQKGPRFSSSEKDTSSATMPPTVHKTSLAAHATWGHLTNSALYYVRQQVTSSTAHVLFLFAQLLLKSQHFILSLRCLALSQGLAFKCANPSLKMASHMFRGTEFHCALFNLTGDILANLAFEASSCSQTSAKFKLSEEQLHSVSSAIENAAKIISSASVPDPLNTGVTSGLISSILAAIAGMKDGDKQHSLLVLAQEKYTTQFVFYQKT